MGRASDRLHLLGVRHHGPGSAASVEQALDALDPDSVLIEGPPEGDGVLVFAGDPAMRPPLALLVYATEEPAIASFDPFAVYSPEWRALRWALRRGKPVRFIDLPAAHTLALRMADAGANKEPARDGEEPGGKDAEAVPEGEPKPDPDAAFRLPRDPLGTLAAAAGYTDGEAWWNALIEQGAHGVEMFAAVEQAMAELRTGDGSQPVDEAERLRESRREAHMRLAITDALKQTDGAVCVVCGAWHTPALREPSSQAEDRALLKGLPRIKVTATWVPWTDTRLAAASGYGAGVVSPGWYAHVWEGLSGGGDLMTLAARWQTRAATLLRQDGQIADTASVIEASRLGCALAALRGVAVPGLDEMQDASLAALCHGERARLALVTERLVIGGGVGEIPEGVPQTPLQADLTKLQKQVRLKPSALAEDVSIDLRTDNGLARSTLLHRLALIGVPWGKFLGSGSSRGTFREEWRLEWKPEFSVRLVEALVHGTTVESAAAGKALADTERDLGALSALVQSCLNASLPDAADAVIVRLQAAASAANDLASLLAALPPLAQTLRYGTARRIPAESLTRLVKSIAVEAAVGFTAGCQSLDETAARDMRGKAEAFDRAIDLLEDAELVAVWREALGKAMHPASVAPLMRGWSARRLYDCGVVDGEAGASEFSRALSPAVPVAEGALWLEGFLGGSGTVLLHDAGLLSLIDAWLMELGEEDFTSLLPALRRATAGFDGTERRRILDAVVKPHSTSGRAGTPIRPLHPLFAEALPLLMLILAPDPQGKVSQ